MLSDDPRDLKIWPGWCVARDVPPYLEQIDVKVAVRFMHTLQDVRWIHNRLWNFEARYSGEKFNLGYEVSLLGQGNLDSPLRRLQDD